MSAKVTEDTAHFHQELSSTVLLVVPCDCEMVNLFSHKGL